MGRTLNLPISDQLEALIKAHAKAHGYASLDECVLALLDTALTTPALPQLPATPRELVDELRKGLAGDGRTPSREEWEQKKSSFSDQQRRSKAG